MTHHTYYQFKIYKYKKISFSMKSHKLSLEIRQLRNKKVPLVKVLWKNHDMEEAAWEPESTMRVQYPQLFSLGNFDDEIYFKGGGGGGWGEL